MKTWKIELIIEDDPPRVHKRGLHAVESGSYHLDAEEILSEITKGLDLSSGIKLTSATVSQLS